MIDKNSVVVNLTSPADITLEAFSKVLSDANSPAAGSSEAMYNAVVAEGISVAFFLACFFHESQFGKVGICYIYQTRSPGNTRSSTIGVKSFITDPVKGRYVKYATWGQGARDMAHRLIAPGFDYDKAGATTIAQIMPIFAPVKDGNNPDIYISKVVKMINQWIGKGSSMFDLNNIPFKQSPNYDPGGNSMKKVVIHSTEGSYSSSVGWLLSTASQASAHYVISEDGSQCTQLVKDEDIAWHAGNLSYNRMCIGIEHSWFSDGRNGPPPDSLYQAGAKLTAMLCKKHGIVPNRGNIIAHGEIPPPNDHVDPGPRWDWPKFMAYVIQAFNGGVAPVPDPAMLMNGFTVGHGMLSYWNKVNVPGVQHPLGLPISEEQDWISPEGKKIVVQAFERSILGFDASIADPAYRVQGLIVGPEWVKNHLTNQGV